MYKTMNEMIINSELPDKIPLRTCAVSRISLAILPGQKSLKKTYLNS